MVPKGVTRVEPRRKFGVWTLSFLVIANMIGAGVFTTSGYTLRDLSSPWLVLLAWFVAGCIATAGALSYGQLIQVMPESGGEYLFLSRSAHPILGFIAGWVSLIAGFTGAIAFAAVTLEEYIIPDTESRPLWLPKDAIAVSAIIVSGCFHGFRPMVGALLQNVAVTLKLVFLSVFAVVAIFNVSKFVSQREAQAAASVASGPLLAAFAKSLVYISFSYMGFNAAVYVCDEARDPKRTVPRALMFGAIGVFAIYLILNAIFVLAPSADDIAGAPDIASVAARHLAGEQFATFIRLTVVAALFTSVLSMMMAAPRVYAKMGEDGLLPSFLKIRGQTPAGAVVLQVVLAVVIVISSTQEALLHYLGLTLSLSAAGSVACLFLPGVRREVSLLSWRNAPPAIYVISTLVIAVTAATISPTKVLGTALTFLVGAMLYFIAPRGKRKSESGDL